MTQNEFNTTVRNMDVHLRQLAYEAWDAWTPSERAAATASDVVADVLDTLLSMEEETNETEYCFEGTFHHSGEAQRRG